MPEYAPLTKEEREQLLQSVQEQWPPGAKWFFHYEATVAALEKELAAIVHCADCRYWMLVWGNEGDCTAHKRISVSRGDCYCSWGEKDA